jgi:hypothetical protein
MRRVVALIAVSLAALPVTGCQVNVPGVRQAANPCSPWDRGGWLTSHMPEAWLVRSR